jgi:hypothetical protein
VRTWRRQFAPFEAPGARVCLQAPASLLHPLQKCLAHLSAEAAAALKSQCALALADSDPENQGGHWARDQLPEWAPRRARPPLNQRFCGVERIPGWIKLDISPDVKPDIGFDLEADRGRVLHVPRVRVR